MSLSVKHFARNCKPFAAIFLFGFILVGQERCTEIMSGYYQDVATVGSSWLGLVGIRRIFDSRYGDGGAQRVTVPPRGFFRSVIFERLLRRILVRPRRNKGNSRDHYETRRSDKH